MKISTIYIPIFLFILLMFSGVTWSLIDSQAAADAGGDAIPTVFGGKGELIAGWIMVGLYLPYMRHPVRAMGLPLAAFCVLAVASAVWASNAGTALFAAAGLLLLISAAIIGNTLLGFKVTLRLVWILSTVLILISVALASIGDQHALMGGMHVGRWRGIFQHKNGFGQILALNMLISAFGRSSMKLPRLVTYPMVAVDIGALFMANSATADIGAAVGLIAGFALLPIPNRVIRNAWRIGAVSCALLLGVLLIAQPEAVNELVGRDETMSGRTEMWDQAMPLTYQHKLGTGFGTGGGSQLSIELQKRMHRTTNLGVQSGYINTALELGWIAVILYVAWAGGAVIFALLNQRAMPAQTLLISLVAFDMIESISETGGAFGPTFLLLTVMVPMVAVNLTKPQRFRLMKRRHKPATLANRGFAAVPERLAGARDTRSSSPNSEV